MAHGTRHSLIPKADRCHGPNARTLAERFWAKVDTNIVGQGCWEWLGGRNPNGYGLMWGDRKKVELAHRLVYRILGLPELPDRWETGLVPDHWCKNPCCVNPAHQRIVTQTENTTIYADRSQVVARQNATMAARGTRRGKRRIQPHTEKPSEDS